jgi:acyl carrier protein
VGQVRLSEEVTSLALQASVEHMRRAFNADIERIVTATVQRYLGASATLPLSTRLLGDLGIDSLGFVTIIMELADELKLDLMAVEISLKEIDTLQDLVLLVTSLVVASNS